MTDPAEARSPIHILLCGETPPQVIGARLVAEGRRMAARQFPPDTHPHFAFDAPVWHWLPRSARPPGPAVGRGTGKRRRGARGERSVRFLLLDGGEADALPAVYADVVKAWVVLADFKYPNVRRVVHATRYLWRAVTSRLDGGTFEWWGLRSSDFEDAEALMRGASLADTTISSNCLGLSMLARWLTDNGLCDHLDYVPATPVPSHPRRRTAAGRQARLDRLPTRRAIAGLAEIYVRWAETPRDRLLVCAVGLLLLTGLRIRELLTLPSDCEVTEQWRGRPRTGLRFWKRKSSGRHKYAVRWLSPLGAELAVELLAEIRALTESARVQARVLERDQDRVAVPEPDALAGELFAGSVARALGLRPRSLDAMVWAGVLGFRSTRRSPIGKGAPALYARADVEAYLLGQRGPVTVFDPGIGRPQHLSDTLLIAHAGFFRTDRASACPLLVEPVSEEHVQVFLGGTDGHSRAADGSRLPRSAFARFQILEPFAEGWGGGAPSRMRSHMARHWLNTLASRAGMSAFQITLWMGRASEAHTAPYLHPELYAHSAPDFAELVREQMAAGTVAGPRQESHERLPPAVRAEARSLIGGAHKLGSGICTVASLDDCAFTKACWAGCVYVLRTVGHLGERRELEVLHRQAELGLARLDTAAVAGRPLQPRQRQLCERLRDGVARALAVDPPSPT